VRRSAGKIATPEPLNVGRDSYDRRTRQRADLSYEGSLTLLRSTALSKKPESQYTSLIPELNCRIIHVEVDSIMATEEDEEKGRGFRVEDKRRFSPTTGEPRTQEESPSDQPVQNERVSSLASGEPSQSAATPDAAAAYNAAAPSPADDGEISFFSIVHYLSMNVLFLLGEIPPPPGQPVQTDLAAAQQMIDMLAVLQQKTTGNLDKSEEAMLGQVLYDLRMRYVELVRTGHNTSKKD
jgi:hypothetical protein